MKRFFAFFLSLTLLLGGCPMLPQQAAAAEESIVQDSDMTVESTNSFGHLLAQDLEQEEAEEAEEATVGYNVIGLTIEDGVATVEYDTRETANLVVALYTEDGMQQLLSAHTTVEPEETVAQLTFADDLPDYFLASAYLLDSYDYSPLCTAYETPMYTREMQELLASTTDDYDADRVLNLDEDETTNFAVFKDAVKVIEYTAGVNTVASADDEAMVYVIENADAAITSLTTGDIFAYTYADDEILIVRVDTLTLNGTTATVTGDALELEEVFSYVKIEGEGDTEDVRVDESTGDEGITFTGIQENEPAPAQKALDGDIEFGRFLGFKLKDEEDSVKVEGTLGLEVEVKLNYYISLKRQFLEFKVETKFRAEVESTQKWKLAEKELQKFDISPIPGVFIGFEPKVTFDFSVKIKVELAAEQTFGYAWETGKGGKSLTTEPKVTGSMDIEGSVFVGIDMNPRIKILAGWLADSGMKTLVGIELKGKMEFETPLTAETAPEVHTCKTCLSIELYAKVDVEVELQFLRMKKLTYTMQLLKAKLKLGSCYYSFHHFEFGWGSCPHKVYRVTACLQDAAGGGISDVALLATSHSDQTRYDLGTTDQDGTVVKYLPGGTYTVKATVDQKTLRKEITVTDACRVVLRSDTDNAAMGFVPGVINPEDTEEKTVVSSGDCGAQGDNVRWTLYSNGLLRIYGSGAMRNYDMWDYKAPWRYSAWTAVLIEPGVTTIGDSAFYSCTSLTSVTIPDSVTTIGGYAFSDCTSLTSATIPDSVTTIGFAAFSQCNSLTTVSIPDSVTTIGDHAFDFCTSLTSVTIGDSVTTIGDSAFINCDSLTGIWVAESNPNYTSDAAGVLFDKGKSTLIQAPGAISGSYTIPDSVTTIRKYAFSSCTRLISVTIPDSVTTIGDCAFTNCDSLISVIVPDSVTTIGSGVFSNCNSLISVTIPDSVITIGKGAFDCCVRLTSVSIPDSVTTIGDYAFDFCTSLTSVTIGDSVTTIGNSAFAYCLSLTTVIIPDSVTTIGSFAFYHCTSLTEMVFCGDAPIINDNCYSEKMTAYYPEGNDTWNQSVMKNYGGDLTWVAYTPGERRSAHMITKENPMLDAVFGGDFSVEKDEFSGVARKTAAFRDLVPGEEYVLLVVKDLEAEVLLASENLQYIRQAVAGEDGALRFEYQTSDSAATCYAIACGASNQNLRDAQISIPTALAGEEAKYVQPVVTYDGQVLTEGVDYTVSGAVAYSAAGTYTCYIRGIRQYTGTVACTYTVVDAIPGDLDGNETVNEDDAIYLLQYVLMPDLFPVEQPVDYDGNSQVNEDDAIYLLQYVLMPDLFPIT